MHSASCSCCRPRQVVRVAKARAPASLDRAKRQRVNPETQFAEAFHALVDALRASVSTQAIENAIRSGRADALANLFPQKWEMLRLRKAPVRKAAGDGDGPSVEVFTDETAEQRITRLLAAIVSESGRLEAERLGRSLGSRAMGFKFDLNNPYAIEWLKSRAGELIDPIRSESLDAIRAILVRGFEEHRTPQEIARDIRDVIGLNRRQAIALYNRKQSLLAEEGADPAQVKAKADAYAKRLIADRATLIARTEIITAQAEGTRTSWLQARDDGYLPVEAKRKWIAAIGSARTCPRCIELASKAPVGLDEPFRIDGREVMRPPLHPQCRCTHGVVFGGS